MRNLNIWMLLLILMTYNLYAQEAVYIGMSKDEFKTGEVNADMDKVRKNQARYRMVLKMD